MFLTVLSIFQSNVPFFDCTVKEFIIGFVAIVAAVWLASYVFAKVKAAFG